MYFMNRFHTYLFGGDDNLEACNRGGVWGSSPRKKVVFTFSEIETLDRKLSP